MKNKGITLITLVITIIILLILAGITIRIISSENGIISGAKKARLETKRENIREFLNLKLINQELFNYENYNSKNIIEGTRKDTIEDMSGLEQLGKDINIKDVEEDENEVYFFVIVDGDVYKVSLQGVTYIGERQEDIELKTGDIVIEYNPKSWTNKSVTVKIKSNISIDGCKLVYKTDDMTEWENYDKEIIINKNINIYAKLEGILGQTKYVTGTIRNIDKLEPKDFTPTVEVTTNSIKVTASTTDEEETEEYGTSGMAEKAYRFSKDNGATWTEYQERGEYTFSGLNQNTTYNIKVGAKDNAGNEIEVSVDTTTGTVPGIQTGDVTFTCNPTNWTNGNVTVTITGNKTGYKLQYKTEKTGQSGEVATWADYTGGVILTRNQSIYARVVDTTEQSSETYATGTVTNIDKTKPTINSPMVGKDNGQPVLRFTCGSPSGGEQLYSLIEGYYVSTNPTTPTPTGVLWINDFKNPITGLITYPVENNKTYYIWAKDQAGNISDVAILTVKY